ncbi:methyltransferase [Kribbella sp. HUAS MG21]|uniref:Methyltransferase n=1 Tax=Kribbella sp. HUAS MG21 TaxID=3160966 RepID=A0AAU7TP46_9ACTN
MDVSRELHRLVTGYQATQAVSVAASLRLSDLLAAGPRSVAELAEAAGADEQSLARLMHTLTVLGLYRRAEDGTFTATELGAALRTDGTRSIADWVRFVGRPFHWQAYGALEHSVRTGETAFRSVHGESMWEYAGKHPDDRQIFDAAMTSVSQTVADDVVDAYDFGRFSTVVDVGGGRGLMLSAILRRYPAVEGVLFDLPDVVASAPELLANAGVWARCRAVGGSFFDAVPAGADAYVLKAVIHDWADSEAIEILRVCRTAMPPGARLLLLEQLLDATPDPVRTALSDLTMLVMAGGRERTTAEYRTLLTTAGLSLVDVVPTASTTSVIEAVAH